MSTDTKTKRVALVFGAMRQNVAAEHMALAELEACDNVEMDDDGTWIKRPGFDRAVPSIDTGFWTPGGGGAVYEGQNDAVMDGADRCWSFDRAIAKLRNRGAYPRGYAKPQVRAPISRAIRTITVSVSTDTWIITQTELGYVIEIINTSTGARVQELVTVSVAGIAALAAVATATNVWVFITKRSTTVTAHKFVIATPSVAPTSTTYLTTAGATWASVDAFTLSASTEIVVLAQSIDATTAKYVHSYLDPATGASRASPAAVVVSNATVADMITPATNGTAKLSISCLSSSGLTTFFYAVWDQNTLKLVEVTSSTLAAAATTSLLTETMTAGLSMRAIASGYIDTGTGNWEVFSSDGRSRTGVALEQPSLARFTKNGGSFTNQSYQRHLWVASRPVTISGSWHVAVQYESYLSTDLSADLQRTLYIMTTDGHLIARVLPGLARANTSSDDVWPTTPDARANGIDGLFTSMLADVTGTVISATTTDAAHNPVFVRVETSLTRYGRPVKYMNGKVCIPAGIPGMFGSSDRIKSLTPLMFPTNIQAGTGTGAALAGETGVAIVYRFVDSDGTVQRSSPALAAFTFNAAGTRTVTVDNLRVGHRSLTDGATFGDPLACTIENRVEIEIYLTEVGLADLQLFKVIANDPATNAVTVTIVPDAIEYISAELLYTTGGRLSNAVAPQTHAAAFWRDRLHLASDDFVFSSDESTFGFAPAFSEFKRKRYLGEDITALEPIDWNYLAAFKASGVAALSGAGPDNRGSSNYDLQELNTRKGVDRPRAVVQSLNGCHFTDSQDGQQCVVTPGLSIVEVGDGVFDSRSTTVKDAVHIESLRQVWILMADKILVLDYDHPTKEQPYGRWSTWTSTGISGEAPEMALVDPSGPAYFSNISTATIHRRKIGGYTDDTSGSAALYNELMRAGEFPFAGLGGEYTVQEVLVLIENLRGSTITVALTLSSDLAEKDNTKSFNVQATDHRIAWKPGNQSRVGGTKIQISSNDTSVGYRLIAVIVEVSAEFHGKFPKLGERS